MDAGHPPLLGRHFEARFEVRGTLGAGGAGIVYRAFDRQLQREVALKLLRQASGRDLYRFKREFRALADIVHPNLVALHELHAADGDWYFTMELVEGVSFIDWVRPGKAAGPARNRADITSAALDERRLRGALVQLVDALLALHKAGKLHRDLKPSNVLVTQTGRLALLDFGLVTGLAEGNPERLAVGTPVYMSPEQASDQKLSEASDWYSVGAMLYEALTGRRPFEGDSEQVMLRKQAEQPRPPQQIATGVPVDLAKLCMALLAAQPAERPGGDRVLQQLGARPSAFTRGMAQSYMPAAFVGRELEIDALRDALEAAGDTGMTVLIRGKSGIGKSTLVRRFLGDRAGAIFAIEGRCFEREAVPFKMLDGVVDATTAVIMELLPEEIEHLAPGDLGSLVRMFPVLRRIARFSELAAQSPEPVDPQELRRRGLRALKGLLAKLARLRPVVMFVDDAHWGDVDSALFLADLIHASEPGLLLVIAHRPEDYLGIVAQLRRPPGGNARRGDIRELAVSGLTDDEATSLVTQLAVDASRAQTAVAAAGGNPLVLTELARATALDAGARMEDVVRARMARLPPEVQAMLAVSSIAARPLPVEIAAHAAGVVGGHDEAAQLSNERLATLRQVEHRGEAKMILHPAHDYVRAAVLASLDTETKAGWHEALARAFEAVQGEEHLDSQAVVEHWLAAGHPANAAHHAVGAARAAEDAFAFRRAAELYEIALSYGPWDAMGQRDLLRSKAHALVCAGQLDEAAEVFGRAAELLDDAEAVDLERLRVEALLRRGRLDEALPAAETLLAHLGLRIPLGAPASRTKLATQWVQMKLRGHDYVERGVSEIHPADLLVIDVLHSITSGLAFADPALGRVVQSELMRAALDAGEPVRMCLALAQEVGYAAAAGSRNRVVVEAVGKRLLSIAQRLDHRELVGFADTAIGIASHMSGRWRDARGHLESGLAMLRDHGSGVRWEIDVGDSFWLASLFYLGEWHEMARMTQLLLRDAIDRADVVAQQGLRIGCCTYAWLLGDQADEAQAQLAIAERTLGPGFHLPHFHAMTSAANIALYQGRAGEAIERLDDTAAQVERLGCARMQLPRTELAMLRARAALADTSRLLEDRVREARVQGDSLLKEGAPWASALGHLVRAASYAWIGTANAARVELLAAEEQLLGAGMMG
ncbi:MAG: protein kinase, partial [Myxococcota bacterium]|nr:protein kinase [Myxococcota bacterium]